MRKHFVCPWQILQLEGNVRRHSDVQSTQTPDFTDYIQALWRVSHVSHTSKTQAQSLWQECPFPLSSVCPALKLTESAEFGSIQAFVIQWSVVSIPTFYMEQSDLYCFYMPQFIICQIPWFWAWHYNSYANMAFRGWKLDAFLALKLKEMKKRLPWGMFQQANAVRLQFCSVVNSYINTCLASWSK